MGPAARYFFLAQDGAAGATRGGTPKQRLADAFADSFDDPAGLVDTLGSFSRTRRFVSEVLGAGADWEAAKGLFALGRRQIRNTLSV
jgi:hypothetical protein